MVARTALSARMIPFPEQGFRPYGLLLDAAKRADSSTLRRSEEEATQPTPPLCRVAEHDAMPCLAFRPHLPPTTLRRKSLLDRYLEGWAEADPEKTLNGNGPRFSILRSACRRFFVVELA